MLFVFRKPSVKGLVGNTHRRYELDMLFVFRKPSVKGLTVLLLKQVMIISHRAWPGLAHE
jgi:hypothetical protein